MMRLFSIGVMLTGFLLVFGCGANIPRIKTELRKGMTKDEVVKVLGTRGELKKEAPGFVWQCGKGHTWSPGQHPNDPHICPICGMAGHAVKERWNLYRRTSGEWGAVYLSLTFDNDGKLEGWAVGDM